MSETQYRPGNPFMYIRLKGTITKNNLFNFKGEGEAEKKSCKNEIINYKKLLVHKTTQKLEDMGP